MDNWKYEVMYKLLANLLHLPIPVRGAAGWSCTGFGLQNRTLVHSCANLTSL